jgi:acetyltransferase-like isoleucine patch superfamily enzyme
LLSAERRISLAARGRAELALRAERARGRDLDLSWSGKPFFYEGRPVLRGAGTIDLGLNCRMRGGPARTRLIVRDGGRIELGQRVGINHGVEIIAAHLIRIGDDSGIAPQVSIADTNFHPLGEGDETTWGAVEIGVNVWVGRAALIMPGVTIGNHSVVASGAIVTRDVPPRTLVAGNPARAVREIAASEDWRRL